MKKSKVVGITGPDGLNVSECVYFFLAYYDLMVIIETKLRSYFFGQQAITAEVSGRLQ